MISTVEKEKKLTEIRNFLYLLQYDFNYTLTEISEFLNTHSGSKLKLNKGDISKIQSNKIKFSRSIDKLILIHELLSIEIGKIKQGDVIDESTDAQSVAQKNTNHVFNSANEKSKEASFNLFQLFVEKVFPIKYRLFWVFLFFALISPTIPIVWAIKTNVWSGIDYPLNESYSTWLGEYIIAIINIMILLYYKELSYLMQFSEKYKKKAGKSGWQFVLFLLSVAFSYSLHQRFTTDQIFGWCEQSKGKLSWLGYYHMIFFSFQTWIFVNFIINLYLTGRIINDLKTNKQLMDNGLWFYSENIVKTFSNIIIKYGEILVVNSIYVLTFLYTIFISIDKIEAKKIPINTGLLELIGYSSAFLIFGIGFFWNFIVKPVINLLEYNKNKLIKNHPNNNNILALRTFPFDESPFRYLLISFLTVICIIIITVVSINLINRIIDSRLLF